MKKEGKKSTGLGLIIYMEWIFPIIDYYQSLRKSEKIFEVVLPTIIALICTTVYLDNGKLFWALKGFSNIMPTAISILIGFTVMLITLLLTSGGENIKILKETKTNRVLRNESISLYQGLHIQFSHSLFSEVFLLLLIFFYMFLYGIGIPIWAEFAFMVIEIYLTLNILFSILRGITNLYFSFFKQKSASG